MKWISLLLFLSCTVLASEQSGVFTGPGPDRKVTCLFVLPVDNDAGRLLLEGKVTRDGNMVTRIRSHLKPYQSQALYSLDLSNGEYQVSLKLTNRDKEIVGRMDETFRASTHAYKLHPALPTTRISIKLPKGARDALINGKQIFEARITGERPGSVVWYLDEKVVGRSRKEPYKVKIKLGNAPLVHSVTAVAMDASGKPIASDQFQLNMGPYAFSLRFVEPHREEPISGPFLARVDLRIPKDKGLERLDFFSDNKKRGSVYEEPYSLLLPAPEDDLPLELRAVAHLTDGAVTEARLTLNDTRGIAGLEVRNVDLWVTVENQQGLPVTGFKRDHFSIFEDGKRMRLRKFEQAATQPLNLHFLIDTSLSMEKFMAQIIFGCRTIIDEHMKPKDRVGLLAFRDEPDMVVPFSSDVEDLMEGLTDISQRAVDRSYHGSAIYDSMATSLHHFSGVLGRRALIVFTDGLDNRSRFRKGEVLDFARQAGVRLYIFDVEPSVEYFTLETLAKESGGAYYKVTAPRRLPELFKLLAADLRMQYLLRYQSSREPGDRSCRKIQVNIPQEEYQARTIRGYCP